MNFLRFRVVLQYGLKKKDKGDIHYKQLLQMTESCFQLEPDNLTITKSC